MLSCSWLSSCRSRFKSVFSQLLFPGIPAAAAAVPFSWSLFSERGLSFSPAALSRSLSYSSPPYLFPIAPTTTSQPATFPLQPVRRELALPLQFTPHFWSTTVSLPVQRRIPLTVLCGLVQHYTLVQSILYQQKVQLRKGTTMQETLKNNLSLLQKNINLKCRFAGINPLR